ncbi:MAG: cache domain-containing protein, partial [Treponema sp.]|nr:cache domain-containing protein [Treponema sp.]
MKLQVRLTLTISVLMILIILVLSVIILTRSCALQTQAARDNLGGIAGITATDIQRRFDLYLGVAQTLAEIMTGYEVIDPVQRRIRYDDMLFSMITTTPHFIDVYTVWHPSVLDALDIQYANTRGSNAIGQYISMYTRETGSIEYRAYADPQGLLRNLTQTESVGNPVLRTVNGRQTYVISLNAPIVKNGNEVLGVVGINVDIAPLQTTIEELRPYDTGRAALIANNGILLAYYNAQEVGTNFQQTIKSSLGQTGIRLVLESLQDGTPRVFKSEDASQEIVSYPFYVGNAPNPMTVLVSVPVKTVLAEVRAIIQYSIIIAALCILVGGVCIFVLAGTIAKPI